MLPWTQAACDEVARAEAEVDRLEAARFAAVDVAAVQAGKLERLWTRAATTDYYRTLVDGRPDLSRLPVTRKAAVRAAPERFLTPAARRPLRYYETSGTSGGVPISAPRLVEDVIWNTVTVARAWAAVLPGAARAAILLPSDVAPVGDTLASVCEYLGVPHTRCYPFATGISDFDRVSGVLQRFAPTVLFAAPGLLLELGRALKLRGVFGDIVAGVRQVMLLGEVATPSLQAMLSRQWDARVLDASYGSTETGTVAATCARNRLHLLPHAFVTEVLDPDGVLAPAAGRREGELVVTGLNAFARPLLRYETGDVVEVSEECGCGNPLPVLRVRGRASDRILVGGSRLDVGVVESVVYGTSGITGYLLEVADPDGGLAVTLERDVDCEASESELAGGVRDGFGAVGVPVDSVRVVHRLPSLTKSGGAQKSWKKTNVRLVRR